MLSEIDKVCKNHGIAWFADCGTLIGAVRHGGYIPWDDDLDICMMRKDLDLFLKVAPHELPDGYKIVDYHSEGNGNFLVCVNNNDHISFDEERLEKYHGYGFVTGLDIFPLDALPKSKEDEEAWNEMARMAFELTAADGLKNGGNIPEEMKGAIRKLGDLCHVKFDFDKDMKIQVFDAAVKAFSMFKDIDAEEVILTPYWLKDGGHRYKAKWFSDVIEIPFETGLINVPIQYDAILCTEYGDNYMTPVRAGGVHGYPYYEFEEQLLKEANDGYYPYWYSFPDDAFDIVRKAKEDPKESMRHTVSLLKGAHKIVADALGLKDYENALKLLAQCQDIAIKLGTDIEGLCGEGIVTVTHLERYCESLYEISQGITDGDEPDSCDAAAELQKHYDAISSSVESDVHIKREIVFLPWKASTWSNMEPLWKMINGNPDCLCHVIPLPYYERKADGSFGEMYCEADDFPEDMPIVHYESYDFAGRHPDRIVIQNPYDECNYTSIVHPFFHSRNLLNYTDRLTYIPWFTTGEIEPDDERAKKSMEHYVTTPGVVYADEVIVQSERMKETYVDFLTKWAGEKTKGVWEKKIKADPGLPPKGVNDNAPSPKTVFYYVSISKLVEHGQEMTEKMRDVFRIFHEQRDAVSMIFYPDPMIDRILPERYPVLYESYQSALTLCTGKVLRHTDLAGIEDVIGKSSAYYGDPGYLVQKFRNRGLPVMLQNAKVR